MGNNSINATLSAYSISKYALLAGTAFEAFRQWQKLFGHTLLGVCGTILFTVVTILLLDRTAFKYLEEYLKHVFNQERTLNTRGALAITLILGMIAYAGTLSFSLLSVPIIADAAVEDRSDTYKDMESVKSASDARHAALIREANAAIAQAQTALNAAKKAQATARTDAIRAQGGEFARLMLEGNTWVRSAPAFRRQRAAVARHEANAAQVVQDATAALKRAQDARIALLANYDDGTKEILAAQTVTVQTWQRRLDNSRAVVLFLTWGAGVISILSVLKLATMKAIPDNPDLTDVLGDSFDIAVGAIVAAFAGVNDQARKLTTLGAVSGQHTGAQATTQAQIQGNNVAGQQGQQSGQQKPEQQAPKTRVTVAARQQKTPGVAGQQGQQYERLRRKVKEYKRRQRNGQLSERGEATLARMEKELANLKNKKA